MTVTAEIYALIDPQTQEIRYIGKANNTKKRFSAHLRDAKRRNTPVYCWIRKLISENKIPHYKILMTVPYADWKKTEISLIKQHSSSGRLLNIAAGGDEPFCPKSVRGENGIKNAKLRVSTPEKEKIYKLKMKIGSALKRGYMPESAKLKLREAAKKRPDLFGLWANI